TDFRRREGRWVSLRSTHPTTYGNGAYGRGGRRYARRVLQSGSDLRERFMATILEAETRSDIRVEDVEYQRQGGEALLARLYRPAGTGPFPAVVQVHGGAWVNKDRTDNDFIARAFAESGILVASLDFRVPPEAPYPASLADINLGIRWLKARSRTYGSRPDWVGIFGTSSGGHQVLLAAMRPDDPRYAPLPPPAPPAPDSRA